MSNCLVEVQVDWVSVWTVYSVYCCCHGAPDRNHCRNLIGSRKYLPSQSLFMKEIAKIVDCVKIFYIL